MNSDGFKPRLARLIEIQRELDIRKQLYDEYDRIVLSLAQDGFSSLELNDLWLELRDNFADSNVGWTRSAVKRFEVEIIPRELHEKRLRKAGKS